LIFETDITFIQFEQNQQAFILGLNCSSIDFSIMVQYGIMKKGMSIIHQPIGVK